MQIRVSVCFRVGVFRLCTFDRAISAVHRRWRASLAFPLCRIRARVWSMKVVHKHRVHQYRLVFMYEHVFFFEWFLLSTVSCSPYLFYLPNYSEHHVGVYVYVTVYMDTTYVHVYFNNAHFMCNIFFFATLIGGRPRGRAGSSQSPNTYKHDGSQIMSVRGAGLRFIFLLIVFIIFYHTVIKWLV